MTSESYIKTGIHTLDTLLGGRGLPRGATVLLTGEPGTGKTTLVAQIASNLLHEPETQSCVAYLSFEEGSRVALERIAASYEKMKLGELLNPEEDSQLGTLKLLDQRAPLPQESLEDFLVDLWVDACDPKTDLLIVDSVSALFDLIRECGHSEVSDRILLGRLKRALSSLQGAHAPTVILTAESRKDRAALVTASYIVDVVIALFYDKITPDPRLKRLRETVLRCRVEKARGLRIQRRKCCYDFAEEGLKFFETYGAQGLVALFQENAPQRRVIENFKSLDVPNFYPGLHVQEFGRSGLQRTFAVRRRAEGIPRRNPMVLSHIDEYWVPILQRRGLLLPIPGKDLDLFSAGSRLLPQLEQRYFLSADDDCNLEYCAVPHFVNFSLLVYHKERLEEVKKGGKPPETWEELEELCVRFQNRRRRGGTDRKCRPLLIETDTYDSLIATVLELFWSHGGIWWTKPVGEKEDREDPKRLRVVRSGGGDLASVQSRSVDALSRLQRWVHQLKILPERSTLTPRYIADSDWLFARHWYSTLVDYLTATDEQGKPVRQDEPEELGVIPIPTSREYAQDHGRGHSCWGEWCFGIQDRTENKALAVNIISNLMTARKIAENAFSGAGLPSVAGFYETHGDVVCFGTGLTYRRIRDEFLAHAFVRSKFGGYRGVARTLSSSVMAALTNPEAHIATLLSNAWERIERLKEE